MDLPIWLMLLWTMEWIESFDALSSGPVPLFKQVKLRFYKRYKQSFKSFEKILDSKIWYVLLNFWKFWIFVWENFEFWIFLNFKIREKILEFITKKSKCISFLGLQMAKSQIWKKKLIIPRTTRRTRRRLTSSWPSGGRQKVCNVERLAIFRGIQRGNQRIRTPRMG